MGSMDLFKKKALEQIRKRTIKPVLHFGLADKPFPIYGSKVGVSSVFTQWELRTKNAECTVLYNHNCC